MSLGLLALFVLIFQMSIDDFLAVLDVEALGLWLLAVSYLAALQVVALAVIVGVTGFQVADVSLHSSGRHLTVQEASVY